MTPKRLDDMLQMSESEFEELLARAAQEGARRALVDAGLDGREAALDIRLGDYSAWLDSERIAVNVITLRTKGSGREAKPLERTGIPKACTETQRT